MLFTLRRSTREKGKAKLIPGESPGNSGNVWCESSSLWADSPGRMQAQSYARELDTTDTGDALSFKREITELQGMYS